MDTIIDFTPRFNGYCIGCYQPLGEDDTKACGLCRALGWDELNEIETKFAEALAAVRPTIAPSLYLRPQFWVLAANGKWYRPDFVSTCFGPRVAIEVDGFDTHSSRDDITADRIRQRELERSGLDIIRFGGQEVHRDAEGCALEAIQFIVRKAYGQLGEAA